MPNSMTGFARQEVQASWGELSCEVRSVNHRYLEPLIRLPESLRILEAAIRDRLRQQLHRGKVEVNIQLNLQQLVAPELSVNTLLVEQLMHTTQQVQRQAEAAHLSVAPIDALRLLQWPGVIQQPSVDKEPIEAAALALVDKTLSLLQKHRQREGQTLQAHIEQRLGAIDDYVVGVAAKMPAILARQQQKLQQRLAELQVDVDAERLEQEVAILANKSDVDEELDRLSTHVAEVKHILAQQGAIGRRLDFMMQELNREANTLSAKSITSDTTQTAVSLKVLIEQMREQIQNIE